MAASIWGRSNPMASILAITPARSAPMAIELSLAFWFDVVVVWGPAGDGVAGGAAAALVVVGAAV